MFVVRKKLDTEFEFVCLLRYLYSKTVNEYLEKTFKTVLANPKNEFLGKKPEEEDKIGSNDRSFVNYVDQLIGFLTTYLPKYLRLTIFLNRLILSTVDI